jgi:thymidylate kinase
MRIVIEGPDKCGKTTLVKQMAGLAELRFMPDGDFRPLVLSGKVSGTAATFLFFANSMDLWTSPAEQLVVDRDILSMIVYQGLLLKSMDPMIIINLFKSVVYKDFMPDEIHYLINEPFEAYDENDKFEAFGYEAIREAYEQAYKMVELNFPKIKMVRVDASIQ